MEKAAYLGCGVGCRAGLKAEVRWIVEKDRRVIGEDDFGIHLGRTLERCLRDMTVKCEIDISLYQRLASMMMMSFGKNNILVNIISDARGVPTAEMILRWKY